MKPIWNFSSIGQNIAKITNYKKNCLNTKKVGGRSCLFPPRSGGRGLERLVFFKDYMWHFIGKGAIWSKWSYCQGRVVWA